MKVWKYLKWGVAFGIGAVAFAIVSHFTEGPPIHILSLTERDGVAVRGGRLELLVHRTVSRICPTVTSRVLWRDEALDGKQTRVVYPLPLLSTPIVPMDVDEYVVSVEIPGNIQPGSYFYVARSIYSCSWMPKWLSGDVYQTGDVPVRIDNPSPSAIPTVIETPAPITIVPGASK